MRNIYLLTLKISYIIIFLILRLLWTKNMNLTLKTHHIYWKRQTQRNSQIGKILWILRLKYLVKFLNVTSAWRCAINMEMKISVGFNFPMIEPESYFDANTNSVILKCIDSMVNYFNKHIQYTVCKSSFFNNIISKILITLHTLCTCSSMGLQVAFRFARLATSATCWHLPLLQGHASWYWTFLMRLGWPLSTGVGMRLDQVSWTARVQSRLPCEGVHPSQWSCSVCWITILHLVK